MVDIQFQHTQFNQPTVQQSYIMLNRIDIADPKLQLQWLKFWHWAYFSVLTTDLIFHKAEQQR